VKRQKTNGVSMEYPHLRQIRRSFYATCYVDAWTNCKKM